MSPLWAMALFLGTVGARDPISLTSNKFSRGVNSLSGDESPLQQWLYGLELKIGDISQDITKINTQVDLKDILCSKIEVQSVGSSFNPPDKIPIDVTGLEVHCNGTYKIATKIPIVGTSTSTGDFAFTIKGSASLGIDINTNFSKPIPALATDTCAFKLKVPVLHFKGKGLESFIIEILTPILKPLLPGFVDPKLCQIIDNLIAKNLTDILNEIDLTLLKPDPPLPPVPSMPDTIWDLSTSPLVNLSKTISQVLGPNGPLDIVKIVNMLTNNTGIFKFEGLSLALPLELMGFDITLTLNEVRIGGLNTIKLLDIIAPRDKYLLDTALTVDSLSLWVNASLEVNGAGPSNDMLREDVIFSTSLKNIEFGVSLLTAVNLLDLALMNLYEIAQPECIGMFIYELNVTNFNVSLDLESIDIQMVDGALEKDVSTFINNIFDYILVTDSAYISAASRKIANGLLLPMINSLVTDYIEAGAEECRKFPHKEYFDWQKFSVVNMLSHFDDQLLDKLVDSFAPNGILKVNPNMTTKMSFMGINIALELYELDVSGLDTFYDSKLIEATSHTELKSSIGFGMSTPLDIYIDIGFAINSPDLTRAALNLTLSDLHFSAVQDLMIDDSLLNATLLDILLPILNHEEREALGMVHKTVGKTLGNEVNCLVSDYVDKWNFTVAEVELHGADTQVYFEGEWFNLGTLLQTLSPTLYAVLLQTLNNLPEAVSSKLDGDIQTALYNAPYYCRGEMPPDPDAAAEDGTLPNWALAAIVLGGTWFLVFVVAAWGLKVYRKRQRKVTVNVDRTSFTQFDTKLSDTVAGEEEPGWSTLRTEYPMDTTRNTIINIVLPILLAGALATKIWALVATVTRIRMDINVASTDVFDAYVIDFTFSDMLQYFWKSKAYLIAALICLGSCVLPCIKSVVLFYLWFLPAKPSFRGRTLMFFSQVGKGSYIDVFFLLYIILVMRQTIHLEGIVANIKAEPVDGIYGGIAATTANLIASHFLLALHNAHTQVRPKRAPRRKANLWQLHTRKTSDEPMCKSWFRQVSFVVVLLTISVCFLAIIFKDAISWFHLTGILTELHGGDQYSITRTYKMYAMATDLPENTDEVVGGYMISVAYSLLVIAVPLFTLAHWLILWLVPLGRPIQRAVYASSLWSFSFSGFEVFWMSTLAAVLEIDKVARWVLNHTIDGWCEEYSMASVCGFLQPIAKSGKILHIDSKFLAGGWWLLAQCILYYVIHIATMYYGGKYLGYTSRKSRQQGGGYKEITSVPAAEGIII